MATAPLTIGQKLAPTPQTGEGRNSPVDKKISINQSGKVSFPHVMKKLKAKSDDQGAAAPLGAMALGNGHMMDGALPPTGTLLPLNLAQNQSQQSGQADGGTASTSGVAATLVSAPGGISQGGFIPDEVAKGKGAHQVGRGFPSKNAGNPSLAGKDAQKTSDTPGATNSAAASDIASADDQAKATSKQELSSLLSPLQNNQPSAHQNLQQNLPGNLGNLLDKHAGLMLSSSHTVLDGANGMTHLAQGSDKLNQAMPTPPSISVPLKNSQWGDELGSRIMWMTQHDVNTANIKINPPHLGPLEVNVSMHKDQIDVTFHSHHAAVKEALDASIPKLKEMLGSSGLQLGDANVAQHSFSGHSQYQSPGSNQPYSGGGGQEIETSVVGDGEMAGSKTTTWYMDNGAIDFYA